MAAPRVLTVGDGRSFARIETALAAAKTGDEIDVYPSAAGYRRTSLLVTKQVELVAKGKITLDGTGFEYSGSGKIPRAIVQFEPTSSGSFIQGFYMTGAHNQSFNGAAIRIREARNVSVWQCELANNDMGAMSNGKDGEASSAARQRFVACRIHDNGNRSDLGQNHNLYLGGSSAYLDGCLIYNALTGHNLKSRAHLTVVTNCAIYGGDNRQIDCVDSWFTTLPHSDLIVYNSILAVNPDANGNRTVVHFGQERGQRQGCAYLYQSSIYTAFASPVVTLDSSSNRMTVRNCSVLSSDRGHGILFAPSGADVEGEGNFFSSGLQAGSLAGPNSASRFLPLSRTQPAIPAQPLTAFGFMGDARLRESTLPYEGKLMIPLKRPGASPNLYSTIVRGLAKP